jgi:tRNA synthetases class II (D, K and N)
MIIEKILRIKRMINYNILSESKNFYDMLGFKYIEVPWIVSSEINSLTRPKDAAEYIVQKNGKTKSFIASGEQGFLYLMAKGHLTKDMYQTITPCMRNDNIDETHAKYFMKNELIYAFNNSKEDLLLIVEYAKSFFEEYVHKVNVIKTDIGYDIEYNEIEIGSYGIRNSIIGPWIYGTGVAEPRFSRLIDNKKRY